MNFPQIQPLEDQAVDTVVSVLNRAKEQLGLRQTLQQLAVALTAEAFLTETIEKKWRLTNTFMYMLHYKNCSRDESSQYYYFEGKRKDLGKGKTPVALTAEAFLTETIEKKWRLTNTFMYMLHYKNCSRDESSQYYYFEAVFSQPTVSYPIPQATASVYFRVQDKYVEPPNERPIPSVSV
ncbi:hypothetical protein MSG28_008910 [Choristoneura fumiferana]|uniref:Uncharacterized protein n=1 Tax=Choristoneura fumiferana TaxID=7141 RepID=A0ACC0J8G8_CHOFU|nr:hypothetical protein MSG28_008910 [Choristoneura fumiferana]